jgi:hypothetical protein
MIPATELDTAAGMGQVEFTRPNARAVRCSVEPCRRLLEPGQARRIFVDGHPRGFVCGACQWVVLERVRQGR